MVIYSTPQLTGMRFGIWPLREPHRSQACMVLDSEIPREKVALPHGQENIQARDSTDQEHRIVQVHFTTSRV